MSSLLKQRPKKGKPQDGKQWLHPADLLTNPGVVYPAKLLGITEVSQAKGTEVIRDAITKVQFAKHIKQSEAGKKGSKLKKVDLKISITSIKVEDAKTKEVVYSYPLHHISYCADDKRSRKVFAFIAKDKTNPQHTCYVFECEKQAEELTLTVGQAFDLAYRRYLENVGRQKIQAAEVERDGMKQKLSQLEKSNEGSNGKSTTITTNRPQEPSQAQASAKQEVNLWDNSSPVPGLPPPPSKQTRQEKPHAETFDPFGSNMAKSSAETFDPFESNESNGVTSSFFDQTPVTSNTISSPFDDSPTPSPNIDPIANPFDQFFDQQQSAVPNIFDSFDPLDQSVSPQQAPSQPSQPNPNTMSNIFNADNITEPSNNNIYAQPHVQRPRPTPKNTVPSSLPPPPSKQSVKAAKAAAASTTAIKQDPLPVAPPAVPPKSSDLFGLEVRPNSPGNPFSRPDDFDPFADSFDPLESKPSQINNQITDLQNNMSRGMILDNNDLLS